MKKRTLRWIAWSLGIFVVLILVLAAGIRLYSRTPHFHALLRAQVLAALNEALEGEVQFREVTGSVWDELQFYELVITHDGDRVLSAPNLSIRLGLLGQIYTLLSSSAIRIARIAIVEPELRLAQDQDKNWNLTKLVKQSDEHTEPGRLTISLDRIDIQNGKIEVHTADGKQARATALSGQAEVDLTPSGVEVNLQKLGFALSSAGVPNTTWSTGIYFAQTDKSSSLDIKHLNVSTVGSSLRVVGTIDDLAAPTVKLTVDLIKGSATELKTIVPDLPLREDISGRLQASGPLSALQIAGTIAAADGRIIASTVNNFTGSEPQLQGNLKFQDFVIEKVLTLPGVSGKVNGQVDFRGASIERGEASMRAGVSGLAVQGWTVGQVELSGQLKDSRLGFSARAGNKEGTAEIKGNLALAETPAYELTLRARSLNLQTVAEQQTSLPEATINLDAWIKGHGTKPESLQADTHLTLYASQIGAVRIDQGRAQASLRSGRLFLREARLSADGSTLSASGNIASVTQRATGRITYVFDAKEISPWLQLAGVEGNGKARIDGTINGSLQAPRLEGRAKLSQLQMASNRVESGNLRWTLESSPGNSWQGKIDLAAQNLSAGISLPSLEARVNLDQTQPAVALGVEIVGRDTDQHVHRIKGRVVRSGERMDVALQELSFQLPDGTWRNGRPARLVLIKKNLSVDDLVLQRDAQTINVKGTLGYEGAQDLSVRVNGFSLDDLRPYFKDMPDVAGKLTLALQVKGTAARPLIETTMKLDKPAVAGQTYAGLTAQGSYQNERLQMDLRLLQDQSHGLNVKGILPVYLGWGEGRSIGVTGDTNLRIQSDGLSPSFLSALSKDIVNLQGSLTMDIVLRGPLKNLAPSGTLQFQNGGVKVRPLGISVTDIGVQANLTPGAIQINRLGARSGEGQLNGSGRVAIKGTDISSLGLTLKAQDFQVMATREYKANVSGNLVASGSLQEPSVRGDLALKGILRPDMVFMKRTGLAAQDQTIVVVRNETDLAAPPDLQEETQTSKKSGSGSGEESALYRRLRLDVTTAISRGTWIHLDEGSIETTGKLRLRKEPQGPLTVAGTIQGTRGSYTFQGRRFQIEKAELTLTGGSQIDPLLDIVARYKVPQYQIDLVIGGYSSKPTLNLRSDPSLEQADILSVLLFGKPISELNKGEQNNLQKQALKATADFVSSDLRQSVARKLGVDTLEFGVGENLAGGQIEAGKYVTSDVFVSTKQQFGGDGRQEYAIEYEIAPNWQIKSSTSPQGNSGIDIFWRKHY
ncbi:MAG TPA: translocation/assembly module TamB domain-containing protein [Candidatus Binatia bacterium]|nr:translocation/assembly module TamB domain-containing protein [Candidatus Binatia bacterium]